MSAKVSFETLSRKQETFIAALLTLPAINAAARAAGVTEKTAHVWLKQPHVQAAYKAARREAFDETLNLLMTGTATALQVLLSTMKDTKAPYGVRVHAARTWLEQAIAVHKVEQVAQELAELKQALQASDAYGQH
jgi:phage terminase small subunit